MAGWVVIARKGTWCRLCERHIKVGEEISPLNRIWVHSDCLLKNEQLSGRTPFNK